MQKNVLILEDTELWQTILSREVERLGYPYWVVADLDGAIDLMDRVAFAAALVDLSLDEDDEANADGKRVLSALGAGGDHTQSVVVTGRGDRSYALARELLKDYGAFDALEKNPPPRPEDYERVLAAALAERDALAGGPTEGIYRQLCGDEFPVRFDSRVMKVAGDRVGPVDLHDFQDDLFQPLLPIKFPTARDAVRLDDDLVVGDYWSRALGTAVLVCYGDGPRETVLERCLPHLDGAAREPLLRLTQSGLSGFVFGLPDSARYDYQP